MKLWNGSKRGKGKSSAKEISNMAGKSKTFSTLLQNNFPPFKHIWDISFSSRHEKQFPQQLFLLPLKWTRHVSCSVINLKSLSVIVMDIALVSAPQSFHLLNQKTMPRAVSNRWVKWKGMTEMVIQAQSSCLPQNTISAQFFTKPNVICVRKVIRQ